MLDWDVITGCDYTCMDGQRHVVDYKITLINLINLLTLHQLMVELPPCHISSSPA
jgi:hypothetical protein